MNIYEYQYLEAMAIALEDLQCFLRQRIHQQFIYSFLKIKKVARKNTQTDISSVEKRSNSSLSQKNYSAARSILSAHSGKSYEKGSHASFDMIKGAELFIQSKQKPNQYDKKYTQSLQSDRQHMRYKRQQQKVFTNPNFSAQKTSYSPQSKHGIPKLMGLVSQEEMYEIHRPGRQSLNIEGMNSMRNYQQSIAEVDDDDDQFQDIVLSRLDKIEEKVNQMLREKRKIKIQAQTPRGSLGNNYIPRPSLRNVGSGTNLTFTNSFQDPRKNQLYNYQEPLYIPSVSRMQNPRTSTFQNINNGNKTPRVTNITVPNQRQNNLTDRKAYPSMLSKRLHQIMVENEKSDQARDFPKRYGFKQAETLEIYEKEGGELEHELIKNKKLGHFRQSSGTLIESNMIESRGQRFSNQTQKNGDSSRLKQQAIDGEQAFKYIPMSKLQIETKQNLPTKTKRNMERGQQVQDRFQRGQKVSINEKSIYEIRNHKNQEELSRISQIRESQIYRGTRNQPIRENELDDSAIKAYTDQGDFIEHSDDLSVYSDRGIYSEIRELRELTKLFGSGRDKKQPKTNQNQRPKQTPFQQNYEDYHQQQKTQRQKYLMTKNRSSRPNEYIREQMQVVQNGYPQQRLILMVNENPNYQQKKSLNSPRNRLVSARVPIRQQFVEYKEETLNHIHSNNFPSYSQNKQVYVVRESSQGNQNLGQRQVSSKFSNSSEFHTIMIRDQINSVSGGKRLSSGSIASFKSIPYARMQGQMNPSLKTSIAKERSVDYNVNREDRYVKKTSFNKI